MASSEEMILFCSLPCHLACSSGTTVFPILRHFQTGRAGEHFCKYIWEEPATLQGWGPVPPGLPQEKAAAGRKPEVSFWEKKKKTKPKTRIEQIGEGHPVPRGGSLHLLPMNPVCVFLGFPLLFLFLSAQKPTDPPTGFPCKCLLAQKAFREQQLLPQPL